MNLVMIVVALSIANAATNKKKYLQQMNATFFTRFPELLDAGSKKINDVWFPTFAKVHCKIENLNMFVGQTSLVRLINAVAKSKEEWTKENFVQVLESIEMMEKHGLGPVACDNSMNIPCSCPHNH